MVSGTLPLFDAPGSADATPAPHRLSSWNPGAWPVADGWQAVWAGFERSPEGQALADKLRQRLASGAVVYPAQPLRALQLTPLSEVRVVILGQDPYHGPGQAEGLAFSVPPGVRIPPSLRNIFKEIQRDLGAVPSLPPRPEGGSLVAWARQGVLLLNTTLTVEAGAAASHAGWGWEALTNRLIATCNQQERPVAFLLWGAHAQARAGLIDAARHLVLTANHPSPLSAMRGVTPFIGCGHFGAVNRWLAARREKTIDWL